jgi:hypothetical protein
LTVGSGLPVPAIDSGALFRLAPDRGRCRVLDLQPVINPTGAVGRAEALRHDALAAEIKLDKIESAKQGSMVMVPVAQQFEHREAAHAIREAQAVANHLPAIVVDERGLRGLRPKYLIQA